MPVAPATPECDEDLEATTSQTAAKSEREVPVRNAGERIRLLTEVGCSAAVA